jgi:hypothetical protein
VLAQVPSPGFPALSLVASDRRIYVGSFENPAGDSIVPKVFRFGPDGALETSWQPGVQDLSMPHGIQVAAEDAHGFLYLMQQSPPRVLRFDPRTGGWSYYASFAQVPTCSTAPAGTECKQAVADNPSEPDYAAWGPDGSMYVTDYQQALIWKIRPGGGDAHVWFTDPRLDGVQFDAAGIVLEPDHRTLIFDTAASAPSTGPNYTDGKLFTLPIKPDGKPGQLHQLWESRPTEAPDGFALAQSGNVYLALVGPNANQLAEISPQGQELARYPPDPAANNSLQVPYDEPSSVMFDGQRMIVTNLSYIQGNSSHQVLFDVWAGEPGLPVFHPPASTIISHAAVALPELVITVRPERLGAGKRTRVHFTVTVVADRRSLPVAGATVSLGHQHALTDSRGHASLLVRLFRRRGVRKAVATKPGYRPGRVRVRVVVRHPRRKAITP